MNILNLFKKKKDTNDVICGYLDINGGFYRSKEARDASNIIIQKEIITRNYNTKLNNLKKLYNKTHSTYENNEILYEKIEYFTDYYFDEIVEARLEYQTQLKQLENDK